jgi:hypothetical protein
VGFWQSQSSALRLRSGSWLETACLSAQSIPNQKTPEPRIRLPKVTSALRRQMWRSEDGRRLPTCPLQSVHSSADVILTLRQKARTSITTPVSSPCVSSLRTAIKNGTADSLIVEEFSFGGTAPKNNVQGRETEMFACVSRSCHRKATPSECSAHTSGWPFEMIIPLPMWV